VTVAEGPRAPWATRLAAALVIVPAVARTPVEMASSLGRPRSCASLMRPMMNMW